MPNNTPAVSPCTAPNEDVLVTQAAPTITTTASPNTTPGGILTDTATLAGGFNPTGTITFSLHGPNDPICFTPPIFTFNVPVAGNGSYTPPPFPALLPGEYRWTAIYSGDFLNLPAVSPCNAPNEMTVVNPFPTSITTVASPDVLIGGSSV